MNDIKDEEDRGLSLELKQISTDFDTNYNTKAFNKRLIYYLFHPTQPLLRTFVLLDFKRGKKYYYNLYTPQNIEKISKYPGKDLLKGFKPHHALHTKEGNIYIFMYQNGNFIYYLDLINKIAKIITIEDLGLSYLTKLGDTFFIESENIYVSGLKENGNSYKTKLLKTDLDLSSFHEVGEYETPFSRAPHTTLHHKGFLLNVHMQDSELIAYKIQENEVLRYHTTGSVAGHIERSGDCIYVSNHNFKRAKNGRGIEFMSPAGIDKYLIREKKLIHTGYFEDPRGFRFTSHKIFTYNKKEYIATVGQPNRLLVIDAKDMSLAHYDIIGNDIIPQNEDPREYLNKNQFEMKDIIRPVEVSENGEYIVLISNAYLVIYSFRTKKIVKLIRVTDNMNITDNINLKDYKLNTSHTNFI